MDTKAILIDSLFKSFGDKAALEDFSLTISQGEVYGLLGPFGAGKSTLLHILLGFIHPSRGWIELFGNPERTDLRSRIGYMPERAQLHPRFRVREYLRFLGNFDDLGGIALEERIDQLLNRFGLQEQAKVQISQLSRGAQQRLALAQALLNDPDLLILDEPFTGLDPAAQQDMLELLDNLRADQRTILLATPYFPGIEEICDRVGIIFQGKLVAQANAEQIRQPAQNMRIRVDRLSYALQGQLSQLGPNVICSDQDILLRPNTNELQAQVVRLLLDAGAHVIAMQPDQQALERIYVQALRGEYVQPQLENQVYIAAQPDNYDPLQQFAPPERRNEQVKHIEESAAATPVESMPTAPLEPTSQTEPTASAQPSSPLPEQTQAPAPSTAAAPAKPETALVASPQRPSDSDALLRELLQRGGQNPKE